jgi:hypothetical protein
VTFQTRSKCGGGGSFNSSHSILPSSAANALFVPALSLHIQPRAFDILQAAHLFAFNSKQNTGSRVPRLAFSRPTFPPNPLVPWEDSQPVIKRARGRA